MYLPIKLTEPSEGVTMLAPMDIKWAVRRLPNLIREKIEQSDGDLILAGGFIRSCIANEKVNDIDLIAKSPESAKKWSDIISNVVSKQVYKTDNAYSIKVDGMQVQFIHRWTFPDPASVIKSFDFTIAKAAMWYQDNHWHGICDERYYVDLAAKRLVYTSPIRNEDAGGSMLRVLKFYQRGYRIPLDSLGAVMARLLVAVDKEKVEQQENREEFISRVVTGLLVEVDPNSIMQDQSYFDNELNTPPA